MYFSNMSMIQKEKKDKKAPRIVSDYKETWQPNAVCVPILDLLQEKKQIFTNYIIRCTNKIQI